jgi:hypothetical protein
MRPLFVILWMLLGWGARGQDLTGQWTGSATAEGQNHRLVLSITEGDSSFAGMLHWYTPETRTIRHIVISGRFYARDSTLSVREDSGAVQGQGPPGGFYILFYRRTAGRRDMLEGQWHGGDNYTGRYDLTIRLEKKSTPFIPLPVLKPIHRKIDSSNISHYPILQGRESIVVAHIPVKGTDTARVELYDNGEIDGDSVSLFVNGELLVQHVKLAAQPKILLIPIDKSLPVNTLLLVAENLGRLPPNTALMVVTVHGKSYNLFLSTDYKKNASIEFSLQE